MKMEKYNPAKVSKTRKWIYTAVAILIAPYTLLLSLIFIQYIWAGRLPFTKGSGKLQKYEEIGKDKKEQE